MFTLASFLRWLPSSGPISIREYVRDKYDRIPSNISIHPKEIAVTWRYAWTDRYTPDEGLSWLIENWPKDATVEQVRELLAERMVA